MLPLAEVCQSRLAELLMSIDYYYCMNMIWVICICVS